MPYIQSTQTDERKTLNKEKATNEQKRSRSVRQDGRAPGLQDAASVYASRAGEVVRARRPDKENTRSKKHSTSRQTLQATGRLLKPISLQLDRKAASLRITRSRAIRLAVEYWLADDVFNDKLKAILEVIREGELKETRRNHKPYRDNSYRAAYYSAQDRTLLTNILHLLLRLLQEPPETMQRIIGQSQQDAKNALTFLSPDIADLIRQKHGKEEELNEDEEGQG